MPSKVSANSNSGQIAPSPKGQDFIFIIDQPTKEILPSRRVTVKGWLIPTGGRKVKAMRVRNGNKVLDIPYGLVRRDVELAKGKEFSKEVARFSGFDLTFEYTDGGLIIEVDLGRGFREVTSRSVHLSSTVSTDASYAEMLPDNLANHYDILEAKKTYFFEEANDKSLKLHPDDPKLIAFYLPQYHPIPENDKAWGPGFTEWTNVASARPRFVGHLQPFLPRDFGFYDLRFEENIAQQINLAKKQGIYGFCFYYYWFSGQKILDKPINTFLKKKDWDFNFMICWANENWTRRWDGEDKEIIIGQKYKKEDALNFIKDVEHILLDKRYIRVDGKPVLAVYRPSDLKTAKSYAKTWREYFKKTHGLELHLLAALGFDEKDPKTYGFDAGIDFMPLGLGNKLESFYGQKTLDINVSRLLLDQNFNGKVLDYRRIVLNDKFQNFSYNFDYYPCLMPSWDNDARRKGTGYIFHYTNPDLYAYWLEKVLPKHQLVFLNAWNEWGEGTTLEPTQIYGHAVINRTSEALAQVSHNPTNKKNFPAFGLTKRKEVDLAVILHLYYTEQWSSIARHLKKISIPFDLHVSLRKDDQKFIETVKKDFSSARGYVVPNRARDILPFVQICRRLDKIGYKAVLKLHTKKSLHRLDGGVWGKDLIGSLLPNSLIANSSAKKVLNKEAAMIGPKNHYVQLERYTGSNKERLEELLFAIYDEPTAREVVTKAKEIGYFAGSMFWANMETLRPLLNLYLMPEDFDLESGQIDGTTAHAVERLFGVLAYTSKGKVLSSGLIGHKEIDQSKASIKYKYAD